MQNQPPLTPTDSNRPPADGLLLVAHGTRLTAGIEATHVLRQRVQTLVDLPVELCFIELAKPTLREGLAGMAERGLKNVAVCPILLFAAGHAKQDLPAALAAARVAHPGVRFAQAPALESHRLIIQQSVACFQEVLPQATPENLSDTLLLLVGRGSRDTQAIGEMARFARLRWEAAPTGWAETAFLAMAQPTLERATAVAARMGFGRIVVQPHLLFPGDLQTRLEVHVSQCTRKYPHCSWHVTAPLGATDLIAQALVEVAGTATM